MNEPQLMMTTPQAPDAQAGNRLAAMMARPGFVCLLLAVVTLAVFWPLKNCDFINYDDPQYVTSNHHVRQGLTLNGVVWAFRTGQSANWHPLTWLSLMLDVELFGLNPAGLHLMNLLLHAANTVLLFLALRQLTGARWRSALVAALFALHPLHIESVAWIAERKDVLSTLFWLLTLLAYGRYAQKQSRAESRAPSAGPALDSRRWTLDYVLALLFFVLGLMTKPMVVTLPFVLLLLDYWPLGSFSSSRLQAPDRQTNAGKLSTLPPSLGDGAASNHQLSTLRRLVREKIPFFILSAVFCVVTFLVQRNSGAILALTTIPIRTRIENAFVSYARYLGKLFWPAGLALPYPYPVEWPLGGVIFGAALTVSLCAAAWWLGRRWPFIRTGWFWFVGTLIPVIGLVQVGNQSLADRYTYVPSIGIFIILTWGVRERFVRWNLPSWTGAIAAILILSACAVRTHDQLRYWQNSETLFRHTIALTKNNSLAYDNLGACLFSKRRTDEAMESYRLALQINPKDPIAQDGLGCCFFNKGRTDEAIKSFQRSLEINTNQANSLFNLGSALAQQQEYTEAIKYFNAALQLEPDDPDAHDSLGNVFFKQKRYTEAIDCYQAALRVAPDTPNAHNCLGAVLYELGRVDEAVNHYQQALRLAPNDAQTQIVLANILFNQGRLDEAVTHYRLALQINPHLTEALNHLGWVLAGSGQYGQALACYLRAVQLEPEDESLHRNLAQVLAAGGQNDAAVREYTDALRLAPNDAEAHLGMGRILAQLGRHDEAIAHLKEALRLKPDDADAKRELQALGAPAP